MKRSGTQQCKAAHNHLKKSTKEYSQRLSENINTTGALILSPRSDMGLCVFLARTVVGQQLSIQAARTIWDRVETKAKKRNTSVESILFPKFDRSLKSCGISGSKRKAFYSISEAIQSEAIQDSLLLNHTHEERSKQLTEIWGIGQ